MSDVQIARWPTGFPWTIGILDRTPDQLAATRGIEFSYSRDDLDDFLFASLSDSQIGDFRLFRHVGSPDQGLEVQVDTSVTQDSALNALFRVTGLDIRAFSWITPYRSYEEALAGAGWRSEDGTLLPAAGTVGRSLPPRRLPLAQRVLLVRTAHLQAVATMTVSADAWTGTAAAAIATMGSRDDITATRKQLAGYTESRRTVRRVYPGVRRKPARTRMLWRS